MNKFIRKIVSFFLILVVPYLFLQIIFGIIAIIINNDVHEKSSVAIIGNSHSECAINNEILSDLSNSVYTNYSDGGQSMFWTLSGAKKLKKQGFRNFIIEVSNTTYSTGWKTTDEQRGLREIDKKYFLEFKDWFYLLKSDINFSLKYFFKPSIPSTHIRGRFSKNKKDFKPEIVKGNIKKMNSSSEYPDYDDTPLHNFIQENKDIEFLIVRVPQHPLYYQRNGKDFEEKLLKSKYKEFEKYINCKVLDFGHLYIQDIYFSDLEHMSSYGSEKFSLFLSDTLKKINLN